MDTKERTVKNPDLHRSEDFTSAYANHSFLEPSAWDLKIIFGELDQSVEPLVVQQHSSITLPWPQAKVFLYFLRLQVAAHEMANGKINLPPGVIPPEIEKPTEEQLKQEPKAMEAYEAFKKIRKEMFLNTELAL